MPALKQLQVEQGATFEDAPVPLHYGDVAAEYETARAAVVLVDRSDEGRLELGDRDRLTILNRMSTNAVAELEPGEGRATVLTTPIGRIIDRVILHNLAEDRSLLRTSPGRGAAIADYLRRNIFFRDRMSVREVSGELAHFVLYGPQAGALAGHFAPGAEALALHHVLAVDFEDSALLVVALDPLDVPGFGLLAVTIDSAVPVGTPWFADGRRQGTLTSLGRLPDGGWVGLGFVRPEVAEVGRSLTFEPGGQAVIRRVPGTGRAL